MLSVDLVKKPTGTCSPRKGYSGWPGSSGQGRLCLWSYRSETIGKTVLGRLLPTGHCTDSRLKDTSWLPVWRPVSLSWSFSLRRGLQVCHISTGCGGVGRHGPRDTIFVLSISLATDWQYLPERSLYTHLRPQFLWPSPREHVYISSSGGQRIFNCTPARLCLIACFKSCCLNGTEQRARNKPIPIWLIHLFQRRWEYKNGEKAVSLINSVGKTGHLHAKEWNWIIMLHHTQK